MAVTTSSTTTAPAFYNLGPLTTTFVPSSRCNDNIVGQSKNYFIAWRAQSCREGDVGPKDDSTCWPPTATYARSTSQPFDGWGFYSPGILCPSGYEPRCSNIPEQGGGFSFQFSLGTSESAVGCCPTGFTCGFAQRTVQTCTAKFSSTSILISICDGQQDTATPMYMTLPFTATASVGTSSDGAIHVSTSIIETYTLNAPLFQLVHKESDLTSFSSSQSTNPTPPSSDPKSDTTNAGPAGALSRGAAIGIGVGVGGGVILLLILGYIAWNAKKRRRDAVANKTGQEKQVKPHGDFQEGANALLATFTTAHAEPSGEVRSELYARERGPQELSSHTPPIELAS
ncbi:hypothetical protein BJ166DRAFT_610890 [Pestalotiopsis sp. NC0098]|nr:hypothetical protein BJ166DRAFT_610890 [Pestalotiopsis sp. NC0098]